MSEYINIIFIKITSYGWMVLLVGLGLLSLVMYSQYKASDDHAFTSRDKLQSMSGKVIKATEVTVSNKRRHGSSYVSSRYYELSVQPVTGEAKNLRLSLTVGQSQVESVIDEKITALFDADDANIVYDMQMGGKPVLTYDTTRARMQAQAESTANASNDLVGISGCILMVLLGASAMVWNRKLRNQESKESKETAVSPGTT